MSISLTDQNKIMFTVCLFAAMRIDNNQYFTGTWAIAIRNSPL